MKRSKRLLKTHKASKGTTKIAKTKNNCSRSTGRSGTQTSETSAECKQSNEESDTESVKTGPHIHRTQRVDSINIEQQKTTDVAGSSNDDISDRYRSSPGGTTEEVFVSQGTQELKRNERQSPTMPNLFYQDNDGDTYLHIAIVQCNQSLVRFLVQAMKETKLDVYNNLRQTPLHLAVITGQENLVRELIQSGSDINALDRNGQTPLHLACQGGHVNIVKAIYECTAADRSRLNVNAKNFEGLSPLHLATICGNRDLIGMVISMGADINIKDASSGRTALHHAVESGRYHVVEYFLSRGASANVPTFSGNTPLHTAAGRQMQEMINLLSRYGADVNVANMEGDKPKVVHESEQGKRQLESSRKRAKRPKASSSAETSKKKINLGDQKVTS
ncbi:B-cell lymphoma 3 protein-like [Actinia tenebrosa]|uniref:B-cell lymphoma 3 protein-like n=1 Tax=Actinia tenebrosa TaxID=6105 RepID=A0A6P8IIH7_ACTTE|nr:B-cell lymphoma 3 protein-like [Actinia tenebrosa]